MGLLFGERMDTLLTSSDKKIYGFTRPHVIGFVADLFFSTLVPSTLSDSLRIYFFPLWRADLFFSGFAVEFAGYVWTVAVSGKKSCGFKNIRICVDGA